MLNLRKTEFDTTILMEEIIELQKLNADNKQIKIIFENNLNNKFIINDENRFTQIMINFIGNSIKLTNKGSTIFVILNDLDEYSICVEIIERMK